MNCVDPIKCHNDIQKMYQWLKTQSERDYLLFKFAIHTGIKLSELLNLTVADIMPKHGEVIAYWTGYLLQDVQVVLPDTLREELQAYIVAEKLVLHDLLFQSKKTKKGLSRQQAYRIVHAAAKEVGIPRVGLTTLRKTFAYHTYRSGVSISIIQKYLGHQTAQETLKFIGVPKKGTYHTMIALNL
ncbi:tyrosine-type recombinase/integrase [Staphylococcus americanisciuri]|uniref:Tyrosine-type recombinase/integrase n=1 Tax=Staphylococcus americanisciuri TaxID=2973940 RepID=A0ABT2F228_9STAP|nr:tyrosine-type recombinase/integrase [Staphylococcus americanisciuri]MCS4486504.1 tyrosine-type recombinase/integrase [Staphylococcus americanisciuri]